MRLRLPSKLQHARRQLAQDALARDRLVARMQRRKLDRNAGPVGKPRIARAYPDRLDGARVREKIALGISGGARALAEHIVGVAEFAMMRGAAERLLDALP